MSIEEAEAYTEQLERKWRGRQKSFIDRMEHKLHRKERLNRS